LAGTTVLFGFSLWGLAATRNDGSLEGVYLAFTFGVLAWAWQEVSFYTGFVTGSRKQPCKEGCSGWEHFIHAVQTSLYHELAIIASALVVWWITRGGVNQVGKWTFLIMWWMHQSAKLNVFFGVRNLNEEFLPEHLRYLKSFFTKKGMNPFFPISVTVSTLITAALVEACVHHATTTAELAGLTFLIALMALAILEHWLLVVPVNAGKLWHSGLASRKATVAPADVTVIAGFLGAGKTTFLRRLLSEGPVDDKTVVLINDFGAAGVDTSLVGTRGADVVELPNGCICCSLKSDLAAQLRDTVRKFAPRRVLIEPSGVAEVATLLSVLTRPALADTVASLRVITLVDASAFLADYQRMPEYFEAQIAVSPTLVINKTDLVSAAQRRMVEHTLRALTPSATILYSEFGVVDRDALATALGAAPTVEARTSPDAAEAMALDGHAPAHAHHHHHHEAELGYATWDLALSGTVPLEALELLLERMRAGEFGVLRRAKGVIEVHGGWVRFDIAGGRVNVSAHIAATGERARAMAIGERVEHDALTAAFRELSGLREPAMV
jgi:putative photosynthetic complex assembly protein 2